MASSHLPRLSFSTKGDTRTMQYHVDNVRPNYVLIQVLEEEIRYYKTLLEPHYSTEKEFDIRTTINFLQQRVEHLAGKKKEWPFVK
jgi:hypothetical protein